VVSILTIKKTKWFLRKRWCENRDPEELIENVALAQKERSKAIELFETKKREEETASSKVKAKSKQYEKAKKLWKKYKNTCIEKGHIEFEEGEEEKKEEENVPPEILVGQVSPQEELTRGQEW